MQPTFDAKWRAQALQGDPEAINTLAAATEALFQFCFYRVGRNRHLCEEVVQETLVLAITRLERYEPDRAGADIFPWLSGLARNEIRRILAREQRSARIEACSLESFWVEMDRSLRDMYGRIESEPLGDDTFVREETREMVNATMSQLPTSYRAALEDKYVRGFSVREIASATKTTEKAVESRLSRARRAFRETFLAMAKNLDLGVSGR